MERMDGSGRRERKDMRRNLERVLTAAHELFAERGPDVTMEEVARRAGVGVGTIYRRFPSKEQLFAAVSHAVCTDAQHCLHKAAQEAPDPVSKLRALIHVQYERNGPRAILIDMRPGPNGEGESCGTATDQEQLYATFHEMLQNVIREGQRQGSIRSGDPAVLAALCLELLNPRTFQHLQQITGGSADEVAEQAIGFVLGGLGIRSDRQ